MVNWEGEDEPLLSNSEHPSLGTDVSEIGSVESY